MKPSISFVIPVRNDAARLDACVRSILRNEHRRNQIEIVVVDNDSTDGSATVAAALGCRVIRVSGVSVSELRNRGAREATAEVLAFVDADNEIAPGWVYAALTCLHDPGVGIAGALCHAPSDGTWVQRIYNYLRGTLRGQHEVEWLGSGNLAVRRGAFEAVGGFDTSLETCEDVDFCRRVVNTGLKVISDARLRNVHHGDPRTLREVFSGERWRGRDNLRVSFRRPIAWSGVPSAIIPVMQLFSIALAIAGVIELATIGRFGHFVIVAALVAFVAPTWLRVFKAATRDGRVHLGRMCQAFVVACAYDCGRALALVLPAPHRRSQTDGMKAA